jgi:hypothetical protein
MIVLFTDFGFYGPYTGQVKAVLHQMCRAYPLDAPVGNPNASAYLLAAYAAWFPVGTVFLCVVDPGVGGTRPAMKPTAGGTSALAMVCLSWSCAAAKTRSWRLEAGAPLGQVSRARSLRTGRSHAGERRDATWTASAFRSDRLLQEGGSLTTLIWTMCMPRKQSSRTDWPKPRKRRAKPPATGNKRLADQTRKILGRHYASKYRVQ